MRADSYEKIDGYMLSLDAGPFVAMAMVFDTVCLLPGGTGIVGGRRCQTPARLSKIHEV
jgi:hypothetical protein